MRLFLMIFTLCEGELNINSRCVKQLRYNTNGQERLQYYDEYSHPKTQVGVQWSVLHHHDDHESLVQKSFQFLWQLKQFQVRLSADGSCSEQSSHLGEFRWNLQHHEQQSTKYSRVSNNRTASGKLDFIWLAKKDNLMLLN